MVLRKNSAEMKRFLADSFVLIAAYFAAFLLRFDFETPSFGWRAVCGGVPMMWTLGVGTLWAWGCFRLRSGAVTLRNLPCFAGAVGTMVAVQLLLRGVFDSPEAVGIRPPISVALMAGGLSLLGLLSLRYVGRLQLRPVEVSDLLGRDEREINAPCVRSALMGKTVLVTGAGGSIGSELVRQVLAANPEKVLMVDISEAALYRLCEQLQEEPSAKNRSVPVVGDCGDRAWIRHLLRRERPDVLLHAAAYKHVPMMEANPCAALKNNALASRVLAETAAECGVGTFVLVSTDKAVRPVSVMGITKRLAEIFVQELAMRGSQTRFCAVRFGNVLDSSGSAVPKFRQQIRRGGPVTITDPRMKRYFMTIPEAAGLVLQAATLAQGGEIFVLDMGRPVLIKQLVETMIVRSGLRPGKDIAIVYTGIRPGEKLEESLNLESETTVKTGHRKIFINRIPPHCGERVEALLAQCIALAAEEDDLSAERLKALLTEEGYIHDENV